MAAAALMLAHQVAGKAVRDSFFLTHHPASDLPKAVIGAAILSIIFVLLSARLLARFGPLRTIPIGFFLSSLLHLLEFMQVRQAPAAWSLVIYFHIVALGAILLSGFWSLMTESFNPRAAKQVFARITGFGTLGGILGGLLAERMAAKFSQDSVLLLLTLLHLGCAVVLLGARRASSLPSESAKPVEPLLPLSLLRRAPYLGLIALTVIAGTSSAAILDYLFKAGASLNLGKGAELLQFFARFYIVTQILTFLAQTFLARRCLNRMGIGNTISSLPVGVGAGALGALLIPVFPAFALVRSLEFVLRGSLYRSAYELLYTPVPPEEKRAAKTLIDVACDRAGDTLGAGLIQLMLWIGTRHLETELLGFALALASLGFWVSLRLDAGYKKLVQQRLVDRAVDLELADLQDSTTRSIFLSLSPYAPTVSVAPQAPAAAPEMDATLQTLRELRSGDIHRIQSAIAGLDRMTPVFATQLLRLLAWDEISDAVRQALLRQASSITGLLIDHLINPDVHFGIRRRIPSILSRGHAPLALTGLLAGLEDSRFEVRFQCSRALDTLLLRHPELRISREKIFAAVERELHVAHPIWRSHRLLDRRSAADQDAFLDEVLRERADQSLEHIFSLFATVLPREPIKIAFRALHAEDASLRGLAAEYLDGILPAHIRDPLWTMVEPGLAPRPERESSEQALHKLLQSHASLMLAIDRDKLREP